MEKTIVQDTREQKDKHTNVLDYFNSINQKVIRNKLYVGDYTYLHDQRIVVDTKANIQEIAQNAVNDHRRFIDEIKRSIDAGIKIVFLIQDEDITNLNDLYRWQNPRAKYSSKAITGEKLAKILTTIEDKYYTKFYFTKPSECGAKIINILETEQKL